MKVSYKNAKVGQFVTVVKWKSKLDFSYVGEILQILAIDKPFVSCNIYSRQYDGSIYITKRSFDLRQVEMQTLTDSYVGSLFPSLINKEPEPEAEPEAESTSSIVS